MPRGFGQEPVKLQYKPASLSDDVAMRSVEGSGGNCAGSSKSPQSRDNFEVRSDCFGSCPAQY